MTLSIHRVAGFTPHKRARTKPLFLGMPLQISTLVLGLAAATNAYSQDRWVQVHAELSYSRTYAFSKQEPKYQEKTQFAFSLHGTLDQMMWRMDPEKGEKYPTYHIADEVPPSFKSDGALSLKASFDSNDQIANRVDSGSANLSGVIKSWDDFHLEKITPETLLGVDLFAQIELSPQLKGSASSTLPKMPDTRDEDIVFFWPTPVSFQHDTNAFFSQFHIQARTPMGPRPSNDMHAKLYDLMLATQALGGAEQVGGSAISMANATISGGVETWTFKATLDRDVEVVSDRGSYHENMTLIIKPVATNLKVPPSPVD